MEENNYNAIEDSMGGIEITWTDYSKNYIDPKDPRKYRSIYLQFDDAEIFRSDWEKIIAIWTRPFGKFKDGKTAYRKRFGPFKSYQEHFDMLASQYSEVME